MARVVKAEEYAVKRNEILDVAQRLVYTKGYERMAIQDVLDELQISKGAFYHYFDSKQAVLEALVERLLDQGEQIIIPIAHDPHLSALEKLQRMFDTLAYWKTAQKTYHLALLRVWYADDNAIFRWKLRAEKFKRVRPLFTAIIHQGVQEGVMATPYPDHVAGVVLSLLQECVDTLSTLFLALEPARDDLPTMVSTIAAYTDALERVLGVPTGSFTLVDADTLRAWADAFIEYDTLPDKGFGQVVERQS